MSKTQNTIWLEDAVEKFDAAVESGDYNKADAVIKDVADNGFTSQATTLAIELAHLVNQEKLQDVALDTYDN